MFAASKTASVSGGYQISRSLRFNSADSAYLNRTPASAGNRKTYTISVWCKRASTEGTGTILNARSGSPWAGLFFSTGDGVGNNPSLQFTVTAGTAPGVYTNAVFRDVSAWYHIVVAVDTTQATDSNRVKIYINSVLQQLTSGNYPTLNQDTQINSTIAHEIGNPSAYSNDSNFYLTEYNFIDGQALTPSSFGETNAQTGVWQPKAYSGSYGTNGFYLNFSDNSRTPNNFSVTAGAGNDSLVDSPTSYGTDTGVGGTVRGNYCTLNPLVQRWDVYTASITNGNLDTADTVGDANNPYVFGTTLVSSGKFYWEITVTAIGTSAASFFIGVDSGKTQNGATFTDWVSYSGNGSKYVGSTSSSAYGATYTTGDVIGVALDKDAGTVTFYKNNTSQGAISLPTNVPMVAWLSPGANSGSATANFGQRPFAYTAPSGFKALCTQNLPTPTIGATTATQAGKFFNPVLYTGTGATNSITGVGFQPDWVWIKARSVGYSHRLADSVRGAGKELFSNETVAEATNSANGYVSSFNSDGFSLTSGVGVNGSGTTFVAWNWKANGAGSTNTAGTITSTVSANTTSGFSVVTYTGTSVAGTVGHGLGVAPSMVIVKSRNNVVDWVVYHASLGVNYSIALNSTGGATNTTSYWNSSAPTSTTFGVNVYGGNNASGYTYVAYCFAEISGYSKSFSYTGNSSADGPFVYTGFKPAYVIIKCSNTNGYNWIVFDNKRSGFNVNNDQLYPNTSGAEDAGGSGAQFIDLLSNGFKLRNTAADKNAIGGTYIGMAFAEAPQKFSLAR